MCKVDQKEVLIELQDTFTVSISSVTGATSIGTKAWAANFGAGANVVLTATTNDGPVTWTVTVNGVPTVSVGPSVTINVSDPNNVLPYGQSIQVEASTARSNESDTATVCVRPTLTTLDLLDNHYAFQSTPGNWYALSLRPIFGNRATDYNCTFKVTTAPDTPAAWSYVTWSASRSMLIGSKSINLYPVDQNGNQTALAPVANMQGVRLHESRKVTVKAWLRTNNANTALSKFVDIQDPSQSATVGSGLGVKLTNFSFGGTGYFGVTQESAARFGNLYAAAWTPTTGGLPQGYAANAEMKMTGTRVAVTKKPTANTAVRLRAYCYLPTHTGALEIVTLTTADSAAVQPNVVRGAAVVVGDTAGVNSPDQAIHANPMLTFWAASGDGGTTWAQLGVIQNPVYVTANIPAPTTDATLNRGGLIGNPVFTYDSFLAISCDAAAGTPSGNGNLAALRAAIANAFTLPANSQNDKMRLLYRDEDAPTNDPLTYWKAGCTPAQSINGNAIQARGGNVFNNRNACVACGAWADMLISMWALHGIGDGHFTSVVTNGYNGNPNEPAFLVRNWGFQDNALPPTQFSNVARNFNVVAPPAPGNAAVDGTAWPAVRAPAQNNANSSRAFHNHFIVNVVQGADNILYDPSYGTITGPSAPNANDTGARWRNAAVNGTSQNNMAGWCTLVGGVVVPAANSVVIRDTIIPAIIP